MASSYAVIRADAPETSEANLSIVVVADAALRLRCQTILSEQRIASRGASLMGAGRLVWRHRPRVLLLDAARSPRRALGALPALKRLSPETGVVLLGRRRPSTALLLEAVRQGAWGHVAERDLARDLPKAVRMVAARQSWLPRRLSAAIVAELVTRGAGARPDRPNKVGRADAAQRSVR
jgi:DNA-binding NarL/FixJ family response regulator